MRRIKKLALFVACLLLAALWMSGCGTGEEILGPTAVLSPSPSPSPSPTPDPCQHTFSRIIGDEVVSGLGSNQPRGVSVVAYGPAGPLVGECAFRIPQFVTWSNSGVCKPLGALIGRNFRYYADDPGECILVAQDGPFTVPFRVVVRE